MQTEYIVKVGDLFVSHFFGSIGNVHLDTAQKEAERYDREKMAKVIIWLRKGGIEPDAYRIDGTVTKVQSIELEVVATEE